MSSLCVSVPSWGGARGSLFCTKAAETLSLLGPFTLRNTVFSKELAPAVCDSRSVRLLLPVLKMTHGNKQNEPSVEGDRAGKWPFFFSRSFFFLLRVR